MSTRASEWQQGGGRGTPGADSRLPGATPPAASLYQATAPYKAAAPYGTAALSGAAGLPSEAIGTDGASTSETSETAVGRASALAALRIRQLLGVAFRRLWSGIEVRRAGQRRRALRVLETVGMGEKRFVAIVQVEEARFLIGGGSAGVSLLARLDREREFAAILDEQAAASASLPSLAATADRVEAAAQPVSTKVAW